jgi:hypothetical protein
MKRPSKLQVAHHYESRQTPPLSASLNRLQHKGERVQFSGKCLYGRQYGNYAHRFLTARAAARVRTQSFRPKWRSKSSRARRSPSSLNTTDFALDFGSEMYPFAWRRSIVSQSCDFQARPWPAGVSHSSARIISSILS